MAAFWNCLYWDKYHLSVHSGGFGDPLPLGCNGGWQHRLCISLKLCTMLCPMVAVRLMLVIILPSIKLEDVIRQKYWCYFFLAFLGHILKGKRKKKFAKGGTCLPSPSSHAAERLEVERCRPSVPTSLSMLGMLVVSLCPPPAQIFSPSFPVLVGSVVGACWQLVALELWGSTEAMRRR